MHNIRLPSHPPFAQRLVWVGIAIGLFYWFLESWIHVFFFYEGDLVSHIFTPDPHELWKRFLVIALMVFFSVYAQRSINIRRQTEKALALAHEELDQIFQTASVGMRVIDCNFNILKVNKTFETISRMPPGQAVGKKCYEVFAGPKCFTLNCPLTLILNGKESVECHVDKKRPDNSTIPCILTATPFTGPDGNLAGIVESFKDITELEKAKEAIRTKRDQLQNILSHMMEGVCIVNLDHIIEFQNITHKKFIGDNEKNLCYSAFHNLDAPCNPCLLQEAISKNKTLLFEFENSDGESFEQAYTPIVDIDGKQKAVVQLRDVTREKNAMKTMMQAEQLAALGELAAGVAHEINNPINGVINYAQILLNKYQDHNLIKDIAERVVKEGNRIARIVEGLLFFSHCRDEEKSMIFVSDILTDTLTLTSSQLRKDNIILDTDIKKDLPPVLAQAHEIEQVFINLISNARYALNQKYPDPDTAKVLQIKTAVVNSSDNSLIKISFLDHGIGIPDGLKEKVRNPFFTTKKGRQSTGLGLSISHGIVENHGGLLTIDNNKESSGDPRIGTTPPTYPLDGRDGALPVLRFVEDEYVNNMFFVAWGTVDNPKSTGSEGVKPEGAPLDLYYTRTEDYGDTYFKIPWEIGGENSNEGVGEIVWRYDFMAKGDPEEQGECQLRATSDGSKVYAIYHSAIAGEEDPEEIYTRWYPWKPEVSYENDLWFRRVIFWPDAVPAP